MTNKTGFAAIAAREQGLKRQLTSAQMSMIAIGGAIGTGLFMGSSFAIGFAGPGVLISYSIGAFIALLLMGCLAEMTVAHPTSGSFGDRWAKIGKAFNAKVVEVKEEWGKPVDPAKVEAALKANPDAKAVFCQHTETSTGVVNDLKALGKIVGATPAVLVVDAISGLGGEELKMDEWGLNVVVSGSQKGLMTAPGLAFASVDAKAWKLVEAAKNPQPEVHVRPNRRAPYDTVAKVLALAQRNGMQRIGFVGNEQFME